MSTSAASIKNIADMNFRLVLLLLLLNYSSAQDGNCDFYSQVAVGVPRYIYSPNYPNNYAAGVTCRWVMDCPAGYNCRLDCAEIRIPQSTSCKDDRLLISTSGDQNLAGAASYCGTGTLSAVLSSKQRLVMGLIVPRTSSGGRFQCTVTAQAISPTVPSTCTCGVRRQNRIVGGQETGVNEFTMMAALVDRTVTIKCGAVIISKMNVLTAAHCVYGQSVNNYAVVVGEHNVDYGDSPATKGYSISKFTIHPLYSASNYDNDIAVVFVTQEITFSEYVVPVCLPFKFVNRDFAGVKVTLVGWGTQFIGGPSSKVPMKVDLDVLSQSTCNSSKAPVTSRQMCTFTRGKDACQDDSGGPALWTDPNTGAVHSLGIISYGTSCASTIPGILTRVTSFLDWIQSVTPRETYCYK